MVPNRSTHHILSYIGSDSHAVHEASRNTWQYGVWFGWYISIRGLIQKTKNFHLLICTLTFAYQGVKSISFSEKFFQIAYHKNIKTQGIPKKNGCILLGLLKSLPNFFFDIDVNALYLTIWLIHVYRRTYPKN